MKEKILNILIEIFRYLKTGRKVIEESSLIAVIVTSHLKRLVESHWADKLVDVIPGNWDNELLKKARAAEEKVSFKVGLIYDIVGDLDDPKQALDRLVDYIRKQKTEARADSYVRFSAEVMIDLAKLNEEGAFAKAVILTQNKYLEQIGVESL